MPKPDEPLRKQMPLLQLLGIFLTKADPQITTQAFIVALLNNPEAFVLVLNRLLGLLHRHYLDNGWEFPYAWITPASKYEERKQMLQELGFAVEGKPGEDYLPSLTVRVNEFQREQDELMFKVQRALKEQQQKAANDERERRRRLIEGVESKQRDQAEAEREAQRQVEDMRRKKQEQALLFKEHLQGNNISSAALQQRAAAGIKGSTLGPIGSDWPLPPPPPDADMLPPPPDDDLLPPPPSFDALPLPDRRFGGPAASSRSASRALPPSQLRKPSMLPFANLARPNVPDEGEEAAQDYRPSPPGNSNPSRPLLSVCVHCLCVSVACVPGGSHPRKRESL